MADHDATSTEDRSRASWSWCGIGAALIATGAVLNEGDLALVGVFALLLGMYHYVCRDGSGVRNRLLLAVFLVTSVLFYVSLMFIGLAGLLAGDVGLVEGVAGTLATYILWAQIRLLRRAMRRGQATE